MAVFGFVVFMVIMIMFSCAYIPMMILFLGVGVAKTDDAVASIVMTIALFVGWFIVVKASPFSIIIGG